MASAKDLLRDVLDGADAPAAPRVRGPENRTTVLLQARVKPEIALMAKEKAAAYRCTLGDYVSALVRGSQPPPPEPGDPISESLAYHLAGSRVLRMLKAEEDRVEGGPVLDELRAIRRLIVEKQLAFRAEYDRAIDARSPRENEWGDD